MDAAKRGFRTRIVEDCTKGVAPDTTEAAKKELDRAGVEYVLSRQVHELFNSTSA